MFLAHIIIIIRKIVYIGTKFIPMIQISSIIIESMVMFQAKHPLFLKQLPSKRPHPPKIDSFQILLGCFTQKQIEEN